MGSLTAWPDTKPALDAIRKLDPPVLLATLSNGTLRLLIDVVSHSCNFKPHLDAQLTLSDWTLQARHNDLPIDAHFSGNLLQSYKPNPVMYCRASELLGFDTAAREAGHVAMFASHVDDLIAAKQQGVRSVSLSRTFLQLFLSPRFALMTQVPLLQLYTIYIRRPTEDTGRRDGVKTFAEGGQVDVIVDDMNELVELLR